MKSRLHDVGKIYYIRIWKVQCLNLCTIMNQNEQLSRNYIPKSVEQNGGPQTDKFSSLLLADRALNLR